MFNTLCINQRRLNALWTAPLCDVLMCPLSWALFRGSKTLYNQFIFYPNSILWNSMVATLLILRVTYLRFWQQKFANIFRPHTIKYKARPTKNAGLWSLFFLLFIVCFLFPITYLISANTDSLVALAEHSNRKGTMLTAQGCLKAISVDSTHPEDDPPLRSKLVSASTKISRFTLWIR